MPRALLHNPSPSNPPLLRRTWSLGRGPHGVLPTARDMFEMGAGSKIWMRMTGSNIVTETVADPAVWTPAAVDLNLGAYTAVTVFPILTADLTLYVSEWDGAAWGAAVTMRCERFGKTRFVPTYKNLAFGSPGGTTIYTAPSKIEDGITQNESPANLTVDSFVPPDYWSPNSVHLTLVKPYNAVKFSATAAEQMAFVAERDTSNAWHFAQEIYLGPGRSPVYLADSYQLALMTAASTPLAVARARR